MWIDPHVKILIWLCNSCLCAINYNGPVQIGELNVFETLTATGSEYFARQDSGLNQIFILITSNGEKILSDINVIV